MTQTPEEPLDLASRVKEWLQVTDGTPDAAAVAQVAPAVWVWVDQLATIDREQDGAWTANTWLGAVMLAARLVRRRNSPAGLEAWTADGAAYVRTSDPDVASMLHIDNPRPRIG